MSNQNFDISVVNGTQPMIRLLSKFDNIPALWVKVESGFPAVILPISDAIFEMDISELDTFRNLLDVAEFTANLLNEEDAEWVHMQRVIIEVKEHYRL
ncbi:MAG: hypothetical protein Pars93KO_26650 [Parasphingorhabdus sp.]